MPLHIPLKTEGVIYSVRFAQTLSPLDGLHYHFQYFLTKNHLFINLAHV